MYSAAAHLSDLLQNSFHMQIGSTSGFCNSICAEVQNLFTWKLHIKLSASKARSHPSSQGRFALKINQGIPLHWSIYATKVGINIYYTNTRESPLTSSQISSRESAPLRTYDALSDSSDHVDKPRGMRFPNFFCRRGIKPRQRLGDATVLNKFKLLLMCVSYFYFWRTLNLAQLLLIKLSQND